MLSLVFIKTKYKIKKNGQVLLSTLSAMFNEFPGIRKVSDEFLAKTKRRVIPATKFKLFTEIQNIS